jgi:hypothetical protein
VDHGTNAYSCDGVYVFASRPAAAAPGHNAPEITERIEFAMQRSVDREHWRYLYQPHSAPPALAPFDEDASQSISDPSV